MKNFLLVLSTLGLLFFFSGCASSTTYVTSKQATAFNQAATLVAKELEVSLTEVQSVEVQGAVMNFAGGSERTLQHLKLEPKLSDDTSQAMMSQFDVLVSYSVALKNLTTPGTAWTTSVTAVDTAANKALTDAGTLASKVGEMRLLNSVNATTLTTDANNVTKALSKAGQAALTIYGEEKACRIANEVDPALQRYCAALEALLSNDPDSPQKNTGLAGILESDYEQQRAILLNLFTTENPPGSFENPAYAQEFHARVTLETDYSALLKIEKTGVDKVMTLRKAVAALASAHAALANRQSETFRQQIDSLKILLATALKNRSTGISGTPD